MDGWITQIQHFSLHDGPGIRTTVFFAGCSLSCKWCHNPETLFARPQLRFFSHICKSCRRCADVCLKGAIQTTPHLLSRELCDRCGQCTAVCPSHALEMSCRKVDSEDVFLDLQNDKDFYSDTGGVTFSGGEPFLQSGFLEELAQLCKENDIHTAVETAANVDYHLIEKVLPLLDLVICDLKAFDTSLHQSGTGHGNEQILENIRKLVSAAKHLWVRIPYVPGFNDSREELSQMGEFLASFKIDKIELLGYHQLGLNKYESLGMSAPSGSVCVPAKEEVAEAQEFLLRVKERSSALS